jgi:hypothetical protein
MSLHDPDFENWKTEPITQVANLKLWRGLLTEIATMDEEAFSPRKPVQPGERQIAVVSRPIRQLYALTRGYKRRLEQFVLDFKWAPKDEQQKTWPTGSEMMNKVDLLNKLTWASINEEYDTWNIKNLGLRAGWELVETQDDESTSLQSFIAAILGE